MIMTTKGNKATEIRHKATEKKRATIQVFSSYHNFTGSNE
jgi:hypothetical protein